MKPKTKPMKITISFQINPSDWHGVKSKKDVEDLVESMIRGEADWPDQFGEEVIVSVRAD